MLPNYLNIKITFILINNSIYLFKLINKYFFNYYNYSIIS